MTIDELKNVAIPFVMLWVGVMVGMMVGADDRDSDVRHFRSQKEALETQAEMFGYAMRDEQGNWGWILPPKYLDKLKEKESGTK